MPECSVNLSHAAACNLAMAPNPTLYMLGYKRAKEDAVKTTWQGVPLHRNAPTKLMADLGYSEEL